MDGLDWLGVCVGGWDGDGDVRKVVETVLAMMRTTAAFGAGGQMVKQVAEVLA